MKSLEDILFEVLGTIQSRGTERDMADGERTIPRCVKAFNAMTGHTLTNEDGWKFMLLLKLCRMSQGAFKRDDYIDAAGYSALLAEEALKGEDE